MQNSLSDFADLDFIMSDNYKYFLAEKNGITARVLDKAENTAISAFKHLGQLRDFAEERKFSVALAYVDEKIKYAVLQPRRESIIGADVSGYRNVIAALGEDSSRLPDIYLPRGGQAHTAHIAFLQAAEELSTLAGYKNIEQKIVAEAEKERIAIPTPATASVVALGSWQLHSQATRVFTDWIYKVPVAADGKHFIPPQSHPISKAQVDSMTFDCPLENFSSQHRQIWYALKKMPAVDLG
jgi:hypothetical protein